jgi:SAM-dependent methyltransferase
MAENPLIRLVRVPVRPVRIVLQKALRPLEHQFQTRLCAEIDGVCHSLLDVGCGFDSPVQFLKKRPSPIIGVDLFAPVIEQSRTRGLHDDYHAMDVLTIADHFPSGSFDCVLACELIEHLKKEDALNLMGQMERLARKKVIITTPNGFLPQGEEYGNPLQRHLSGWTASQMAARGYRVTGMLGLKCLRGEMAKIRWRPSLLWHSLSLLSQLFTEKMPSWSFGLFCVKHISDGAEG